jgi:Zn-finger nucleic acid-binding protein
VKKCPKCHRELRSVTYEGAEVLTCPVCQGFWFRNGTFRQVKQLGFGDLCQQSEPLPPADAAGSEASPDAEMDCPDCETPLTEYTYAYSSDIPLHRCVQCKGIWAAAQALLDIEQLLIGYNESLDDARAKALPLMLQVKQQIQQEEQRRRQEHKRKKKQGFLKRLFQPRASKQRDIQDIFTADQDDPEDQDEPETSS